MMPKRADKRINLRKNRANNQKMKKKNKETKSKGKNRIRKMLKFKLTKVKRKNMKESLEKNRARFQ